MSGEFDVYFKMKNSISLMRVGLCRACFAGHGTMNLDDAKKKVHDFELKLQRNPLHRFAKDFLTKLKNDKFSASIGYKKYWSDLKVKHGENPHTKLVGKQFVDEVPDR